MQKNEKPRDHSLYEAILTLKDIDECENFFDDLCTSAEMLAMEQRFRVASLLYKGKTYNDILAETGASSATISRVKNTLQKFGSGYAAVFDRTKDNEQ